MTSFVRTNSVKNNNFYNGLYLNEVKGMIINMSIVTKVSDMLVKIQGSITASNAFVFEEELLSVISGQNLTLMQRSLFI